MEKKRYIIPAVQCVRCNPSNMLALSGGLDGDTTNDGPGDPDAQHSRRHTVVADDGMDGALTPLPRTRDLWAD